MAFFRDKAGRLYPISDIERVVPSRIYKPNEAGERPASRVFLRGESHPIEIDDSTVGEIESVNQAIIPAQPGFSVLTFWGSDDLDDGSVDEQPVIGWNYSVADGAQPIVLEENDESYCFALNGIRLPSGQVIRPHDRSYENQAAWEEDMRQRLKDRATRRAKAAPPR